MFTATAAVWGSLPRRGMGDELHLASGVIEGRIISDADNTFRVESFAGRLDVPALAVRRRITAPARVDEYLALRSARDLDADRHVGLARWSLDRELVRLAAEHVREALQRAPSHAEARRLAGYVRLGDVWMRVAPMPDGKVHDARNQALVEDIRAAWQRRLHGLRDAYFSVGGVSGGRSFNDGRAQLLRMESPLAIDGACALLGEGPAKNRVLLAEFLGRFDEDAAAIPLLVLVLTDPDAGVRLAATGQLAPRQDARVTLTLRAALRCHADEVVRRAAVALGRIGDLTAFDDLVTALRTDAFANERRSVLSIVRLAREMLNEPIRSAINDGLVETAPAVALPDLTRRLEQIDTGAVPPAAQNRSEVQEALIALSGVNCGFDAAAWRAWRAGQSGDSHP